MKRDPSLEKTYEKYAYGRDLDFISLILRDGSGTKQMTKEDVKYLENERLDIINLSLTKKTFIASNFNLFVVKFKKNKRPRKDIWFKVILK